MFDFFPSNAEFASQKTTLSAYKDLKRLDLDILAWHLNTEYNDTHIMAPGTPDLARRNSNDDCSVATTFYILNLHCPSCITSIESSLQLLTPPPTALSHSIVSHSVTVRHSPELSVEAISKALEAAGFDVHSVFQGQTPHDLKAQDRSPTRAGWGWSLDQAVERWRQSWVGIGVDESRKRKRHVEQCDECRREMEGLKGEVRGDEKASSDRHSLKRRSTDSTRSCSQPTNQPFVVVEKAEEAQDLVRATFAVDGMTCSSCVGNVTRAVEEIGWVRSVDVNLLSNSATVVFQGKEHVDALIEAIEDVGYDASLNDLEEIKQQKEPATSKTSNDSWKAVYSIEGMTCSACVGTISNALREHKWIDTVDVNLLSSGATVTFQGKDNLDQIKTTIEDIGYDAELQECCNLKQQQSQSEERKVSIRVDGVYCPHCPERVMGGLAQAFGDKLTIEKPMTLNDPILILAYRPQLPDFTIRHIIKDITTRDDALKPTIYHPPSVEERSRVMHAKEERRYLMRLALSVIVAIPTFIIGIVYMNLVSSTNSGRQYLMQPMWAGMVNRAEWALFFMSTVVYFLAADIFHVRTIENLHHMWRRGSPVRLLHRFYRFGSMNMLISLGTSIAYFASIAVLGVNATTEQAGAGSSTYYFDSVVFLTMFLLIGRFLEAKSKARAGDAVASLGLLRPTEAILLPPTTSTDATPNASATAQEKVPLDLLEIGDVVRVPNGSSPPFDGIIIDGTTRFDESSLTGEARLITKNVGDTVFSGTVNKASPISVRITTISGTSLLDQIIKVVREGQARRAPVERIADVLTSHFVPFIIFIGVLTWIVWLGLGLSGALPDSYRDTATGGWAFWSLQFSIAVFVIACPCGLGLAAPTALFVGGGLAAKHGILVKGGGEAFQQASTLDCVVFDKTGTLTEGGEPSVTAFEFFKGETQEGVDEQLALAIAKALEENSGHPIARAIVVYCTSHTSTNISLTGVHEIEGKGMTATFTPPSGSPLTVLLGNEALMTDHGLTVTNPILTTWKQRGDSIALLALSSTTNSNTASNPTPFTLTAAFSITDPLRPSASAVIHTLQSRGLSVYLLSGDNPTTAHAVGTTVGIPADHIIAGVLPAQKADKIRYLQRSLPSGPKGPSTQFWLKKLSGGRGGKGREARATVAMVGDGINDAPALAVADVGIAIGSGSDVALASAHFVLLSANLETLLTLVELSATVFRRVWFNFAWALVYNLVAVPVAAGVLYPIISGGDHVRLDPVWASLAMALSSVSVVTSSLLLRTGLPVVGFRPKMEGMR